MNEYSQIVSTSDKNIFEKEVIPLLKSTIRQLSMQSTALPTLPPLISIIIFYYYCIADGAIFNLRLTIHIKGRTRQDLDLLWNSVSQLSEWGGHI
jgi:hypothetical protein